MHLCCPSVGWLLPASHTAHVTVPSAEPERPAGQRTHCRAPALSMNLPELHEGQKELPLLAWLVPAEQRKQADRPLTKKKHKRTARRNQMRTEASEQKIKKGQNSAPSLPACVCACACGAVTDVSFEKLPGAQSKH